MTNIHIEKRQTKKIQICYDSNKQEESPQPSSSQVQPTTSQVQPTTSQVQPVTSQVETPPKTLPPVIVEKPNPPPKPLPSVSPSPPRFPFSKPQNLFNSSNKNPSSTTPTVTKVEKKKLEKIQIELQKKLIYSLQLAFEFKHELKFDSSKFIDLFSQVVKFKRQTTRAPTARLKQPQQESEKFKSDIRIALNKLTMEKYQVIIEKIALHPQFKTSLFIQTFAQTLHEQAKEMDLYSLLFATFAKSIYQILNETDTQELFNAYSSELIRLVSSYLRVDLDSLSITQQDQAKNHASFAGALVQFKIIPIDIVISQINFFLDEKTPLSIDLAVNFLISVGKVVEEKHNNVLLKVEALAQDKAIPNKQRFRVIDFLHARENNWEMSELLPQVYSLKNAKKRKENQIAMMKRNKPAPVVHLDTTNRFSTLFEPDEEEEDEEEFDVKECLQLYRYEKTLPNWKSNYLKPLLYELFTLSVNAFDQTIGILNSLFESSFLDKDFAVETLTEVYQASKEDLYKNDFKNAPGLFAEIFAVFASIKFVSVDDFPKFFPNFDLNQVSGFLKRADILEMVDDLKNSPFWLNKEWKKSSFSPLALSQIIPEKLTEQLWETYFYLSGLPDMLANETIENLIDVFSTELPETIKSDPDFVIGFAEALLVHGAPKYGELLRLFHDNQVLLLREFEKQSRQLFTQISDRIQFLKDISASSGFDLSCLKTIDADQELKLIVSALE